MENQNQLFRQKTMDRISSPEELHDYMRVTSPRLWMILTAIVVLLAGFVVYAATTRMESTEKISMMVNSYTVYGTIPAGREDLVKIDMEVRIQGHTGRITDILTGKEYRLNVAFDDGKMPEEEFHFLTIGEGTDIDLYAEDEEDRIIYVYMEDGRFVPTDEEKALKAFGNGDVRVRFWAQEYPDDAADAKPVLTGGRLATVTGVDVITVTKAYAKMDEDFSLPEGVYEAEIVTESTTPISFLLN